LYTISFILSTVLYNRLKTIQLSLYYKQIG